jgi:membrane-associated phospholipid phosphatase
MTAIQATRVSWARVISNVFCPPVVWAALAFPIAVRAAKTPEDGIVWGAIYAALVCLLPAIYIGVMVWRGHITDIHMPLRHERIRPFIVTVLCAALAWGVLRLLNAPPLLPTFTLFSLVAIGAMLVITLFWQISMHVMSVACAVVAALVLFGLGAGLLLSPLIPVVGAARLKLNRHTPAQVIAGAALGVALTVVFAGLLPV